MISTIVEWIQHLIVVAGPIGIMLATFVESLIPPIPSEIVLVTAGTTIQSYPVLIEFIFASTAGSYLGTLPFYVIGHKSREYMLNFVEKYGKYFFITCDDINQAEEKFKKYGKPIIFFGRLIPGIRSIVSIPAGVSKMDFKIYTIYTLSGSLLWNALLLTVGFGFQDKIQIFLEELDQYEKFVFIVLAVCLVIYMFFHLKKYLKKC